MLAINSAKGPHVDGDNFAAQVCQPQRSVHIQPGVICQFGSRPQVRQRGGVRRQRCFSCRAGGQQEQKSNKDAFHVNQYDVPILKKLPY